MATPASNWALMPAVRTGVPSSSNDWIGTARAPVASAEAPAMATELRRSFFMPFVCLRVAGRGSCPKLRVRFMQAGRPLAGPLSAPAARIPLLGRCAHVMPARARQGAIYGLRAGIQTRNAGA